ncbi:MAG: DUF6869 domain-containing protein [Pseudomonadota bacterium]
MTDTKKLTQSWIEFQRTQNPDLEWSNDDFIDLANENPEVAWDCILEVIKTEHTDEILSNLAEGPLEDLLAEHAPKFIDRIESISKENIVFVRLIKHVWVEGISPQVQSKIRTIQSKCRNPV